MFRKKKKDHKSATAISPKAEKRKEAKAAPVNEKTDVSIAEQQKASLRYVDRPECWETFADFN